MSKEPSPKSIGGCHEAAETTLHAVLRAAVTLKPQDAMLVERSDYDRLVPGLLALFSRSFGRTVNPALLRWFYLDNPLRDLLVNVATEGDRIIANYSASPREIAFGGKLLSTALSMTTMTDPDYAGKGWFTRLASELYGEMSARGYSLIWGFPNFRSHRPIVANLGWRDVYEVPTMRLDLALAPAERLDWICDDGFTLDYGDGTLPCELIHTRKTAAYLRWRYACHPTNRYTTLVLPDGPLARSYCVVKNYGQALDIVDLRALDREDAELLLRQARALARSRDLRSVSLWAPRHHFLHPVAERLGFVNREPITYFGARVLSDQARLADAVGGYSNWFVQTGDSDVY